MRRPVYFGIPFVNRPDLVERALKCIPGEFTVYLADNSGGSVVWTRGSLPPNVYFAHPLYRRAYAESMNWFNSLDQSKPIWLHCHSDAKFTETDVYRLLEMAESQEPGWAVIYTAHDVLCAYNAPEIAKIGGWSPEFPNYFADNDLRRRIDLAGLRALQMENHTVEHGEDGHGSRTINSDSVLRRVNEIIFPAYAEIYRLKWGGNPGEEKFERAWNL